MIATLTAISRLAPVPRARAAGAVLLGALTICCGVGLMATAGYLIARAAQQPAILSLTVAIVGVRFFGLTRPLARYGERLATHDVALRVLARVRETVYARIAPLAPAQLEGYRRGDLLARMVADVDALQNLHVRTFGPVLAGTLAAAVSIGAAAAFLPGAAVVLGAGLLVAGLAIPAIVGLLLGAAGRRQAAARGDVTAELVELLGAAPEIAAYGGEEAARARVRAADRRLVRLARRDALLGGAADGLGLAVTGATLAGVLAVAAQASAAGRIDSVSVAVLGLLALASFEAVQPLPAAARELSATLGAGRRILELTGRRRASSTPRSPRRRPARRSRSRSRASMRATHPASTPRWTASTSTSPRRRAHRARRPERRREVHDREPPAPVPGPGAGPADARRPRSARLPPGGRPPGDRRRRAGVAPVLGEHPRERLPGATRRRATRRSPPCCARRASGTGCPDFPRAGTRAWARTDASSPAGSGSGSCSRGRCSPTPRC